MVGGCEKRPRTTTPHPQPQIRKVVLIVSPASGGLPRSYPCGLGGTIPVDLLRPGEALAGVVSGCSTGDHAAVAFVATSVYAPKDAPTFVAGVSPLPPPHEWCDAYYLTG